jgi:endonuclease/exonuclease/phosphatase family metal-dependent hydrolase
VELRVAVYNVWGFRRGPEEAAAVLAEWEPDIVFVHECGSRRGLRRFAHSLQMQAVSTRLFPLVRQIRNAILVRPPWRVVQYRLHRFDRSQRFYPRGALVAVIGRAGDRVAALSVHLGLTPSERVRHAKELIDLAQSISEPVVIGADLNDGPESRSASWVADRLWDAWPKAGQGSGETFPAPDPTARIDYVFTSEHFGVDRVMVLATTAARETSDHLPLLADLTLE